MALEDKKIKGMTIQEYVTKIFECAKFVEIFAEAGEDIFGEDYEPALAIIGLASVGFIGPMEELAKRGEERAAIVKGRIEKKGITEADADAPLKKMMKDLGIKLESDTKHPS